ncbi:MAG: hypothetical protein P8188_17290, partial [Gemmatimonadota bacterium]
MTARKWGEWMPPEVFHGKCSEGLVLALERGELELHSRLLGEFLERGPEPVLELTWGLRERPAEPPVPGLRRRSEAQDEPCVDHVHRFGGAYFASSVRGRSGPFASMEQALLALTGERGIPVTSALERIRSTEWTEAEIRERMRVVDPAAAPAMEGRSADEPPPPPSPWSSGEGGGLPVDGAP